MGQKRMSDQIVLGHKRSSAPGGFARAAGARGRLAGSDWWIRRLIGAEVKEQVREGDGRRRRSAAAFGLSAVKQRVGSKRAKAERRHRCDRAALTGLRRQPAAENALLQPMMHLRSRATPISV